MKLNSFLPPHSAPLKHALITIMLSRGKDKKKKREKKKEKLGIKLCLQSFLILREAETPILSVRAAPSTAPAFVSLISMVHVHINTRSGM